MENYSSFDRSVVPATTQDPTQQEASISAQHGSIINSPQLTGVNIQGNLTNNIYLNTNAQPFAGTEETNAVCPKSKENVQKYQEELKSYLLSETKNLPQGTEDDVATPLNKIYTELYIVEGGSGEVNSEHEVIDLECTRDTCEERKIHLNDIFKPSPDEDEPPQRVLTKGIAGIGKTVAVQKFTQDWADGTANQTFQFVFPFTFRDLNLINDRGQCWSLLQLINNNFFDESDDSKMPDYNSSKVLFIFDGLDESKFPLNFGKNEKCRSIRKTTTIDALLTNLIEGKLLHKASVWITSRPAAASKIPLKHIHRVTEVRGFNDEQKEVYFLKTISDKTMARKIFDHLQSKSLRSLHIMCHIPLFCWISGTTLQSLFRDCKESELPKTLTEMYTHFLIIQTKRKQQKSYQEDDDNANMIMKMGKLAFEQLQKGNIIFFEKDLKDCEIDLKQAVVYSGVCTQVIRKEQGLHKQEFYSFIHLSVQEFLAALYVQENFMDSGNNLLLATSVSVKSENGGIPVIFLHKDAVKKALDRDDGRWDLFLRFLFGLSQEKNQKLLEKLVGPKKRLPQSIQGTINYIHGMIRKLSYTDKSINLFHCLNELGDQSLVEQVQNYQSSGDITKMSPSHWSALAFVLLVSNEDLSTFDLKKYHGSDEVLERLLRVLKAAKTALMSDCNLSERCCKYISQVLGSSSGLEELDLSKNKLQDSGMKLLSSGLGSSNCKLQKLSLKQCGIREEGCQFLVSGLALNLSHLRELDLSQNKFHDDGMMLLSSALQKCCLETLRLSECGATEEGCKALVLALCSNPSRLKNLDLSRNSLGSEVVSKFSDFLKDPGCKLQRLWLFRTKLQSEDAAVLGSALRSNPSHLKELDLGGNEIGDDGVKEISALLENPNCKMDALRLEGCRFTETGCAVLASSLKSNPAHLRVLNLGRNDLKDRGAEHLSRFLEDSLCQLETLNLMCCTLTTVGCQTLSAALSRSSVLKQLNLSHNPLEDQGLRLLSDWLQKPQCRLEVLSLSSCKLTTAVCENLIAALSCSFTLTELNMSLNNLDNHGLTLLSDWHQKPGCRLKILRLSEAKDSSGESLVPVQRSNPSYQGKLEMNNVLPGKMGLKLLPDFQKKDDNKLLTLMMTEGSNQVTSPSQAGQG